MIVEAQDDDSPFNYIDTASSRARIVAATRKLEIGSVATVGLGGTGPYILDLVAKTPVKEIHLFDGDKFGQHNAFRAPGAPSIATLRGIPRKASYFKDIYSAMHRNIFVHEHVDESTVDDLRSTDFVFVAINGGDTRKFVTEKLGEFGVPFIDLGMGTPLNPEAWEMTFDGRSIFLYPSIGNRSLPCRSHYWIRRNRIQWARSFPEPGPDADRQPGGVWASLRRFILNWTRRP